jgi:hypothetical protein
MVIIRGEATNTNFIVFGLTGPGLKPAIEASTSTLTIIPLMLSKWTDKNQKELIIYPRKLLIWKLEARLHFLKKKNILFISLC